MSVEWIPIIDGGKTYAKDGDLDLANYGRVCKVQIYNGGNTVIRLMFGGMTLDIAARGLYESIANIYPSILVTSYTIRFLPPTVGSAKNKAVVNIQIYPQ